MLMNKQLLSISFLIIAFNWSTAQTQLGDDIIGSPLSFSGNSVTLSADGMRVAIGAPITNTGGKCVNCGQARIFDWDGSQWQQMGQDIIGLNEYQLGNAVALSADGNTLAIAAFQANILNEKQHLELILTHSKLYLNVQLGN